MAKRLYVGNLPFNATTDTVRAAFEAQAEDADVAFVRFQNDVKRPENMRIVALLDGANYGDLDVQFAGPVRQSAQVLGQT